MNKYFSASKILSYKMPIVFIIGIRSAGKSFSLKKIAIRNYLKKAKRFICIYKTDVALRKKVDDYFYDILKNVYKDYKMQFVKATSEYQIKKKGDNEWHTCGYAYSVKDLQDLSGKADLESCGLILYDEFMQRQQRQLISPEVEVEQVLNLYITVARGFGKLIRKDVRLVFLSNAFTIANPFFVHFGLDKKIRFDKEVYIDRQQNIAVQIAVNSFVLEALKDTKFYKSIKGSKLEQFAYDNKFLLDNSNLIRAKPKRSYPRFNFIIDNKNFILFATQNYYIFADEKNPSQFDKDIIETFVLTDDDLKPNYKKIEIFKKTKVYKRLIELYQTSKLYFTSQNAYNNFLFLFNL